MALTDVKIKNLKPRAKSYKVSDFDGLFVAVQPSGSRLFRFKYRLDGKEGLLSFGKYPDVSLLQARQKRDDARKLVAAGINPSLARQEGNVLRQQENANTFEKIAALYLAKITIEGRAPATLKKVSSFIAIANKDFGRLPINDISSAIVLKTLKKSEAKELYETAHRIRSTVGAVFRYAIANGLAENDPTFALRDALIRQKTKSRAAITDKDALVGLLRAISGYNGQNTTRLGLELLAIVTTRPGELRLAEWAEFDFEANVWKIPAERMKMRIEHAVPLPRQAIKLLLELKEETGHGRLLFPSTRSFHRPISENTLNAALRRMDYTGEEMTSHGFRATFSTLANESGLWHPDAIERALAHVERNEVRRAYARGAFWEERVKMSEWWAEFLDDLRAG
ncbi:MULTISPECIES: tyrosine-type recombinase/integrase [unclassified Falsihalocynthiibacter]|uniref:tyrosine-type recombinase/integrase n=1 Tax=unclassified Falsihalocynthiibacter TaxID=2854191 RepID=UPI0035107DD8